MKIINKIFLLISIICILSLGTSSLVFANSPESIQYSDGIIFGDYTLRSGDTNQGDMVFFGGQIIIEKGATVIGSVAVIGGELNINGKIIGDIVSVGGSCEIGDTAEVTGGIISVGSTLSISDQASIVGENIFVLNDIVQIPAITIIPDDAPNVPNIPVVPNLPDVPNMPNVPDIPDMPDVIIQSSPGIEFLRELFSTVFMVLAVAALGLLIGVLFPKHLKKTATSIVNEPVKSGVLGLLTVCIAPIVFLVLAITIILLPVSLILAFALGVLLFYGWVAFGYEIGERIAKAANVKWEPSITAGIGTLALSTIAAMIATIPCIGFLFYPIVLFIGLGGVFISQFGRREVKTVQPAFSQTALPVETSQPENEISEADPGSSEDKTG